MAFWLLRGTLATLAVVATLIPAGAVAIYGFGFLEAQEQDQDRREYAHQELMLFQAEIERAEGKLGLQSEGFTNFAEAELDIVRTTWLFATDYWRQQQYASMAEQIQNGRDILSQIPALSALNATSFDKSDFENGETEPAPLAFNVAGAGALAALALWTIWGGLSQRPVPVKSSPPIPVYPGEAEIPRTPPEPRGQPIPLGEDGLPTNGIQPVEHPWGPGEHVAKEPADNVVRTKAVARARPTASHPAGRPPAKKARKEPEEPAPAAEPTPDKPTEPEGPSKDDNPAKLKE